jgi:hypothetical protein
MKIIPAFIGTLGIGKAFYFWWDGCFLNWKIPHNHSLYFVVHDKIIRETKDKQMRKQLSNKRVSRC